MLRSVGFCRVNSMGFSSLDSTLRGVGRPTGGLNAELLCVLGVQSLPATELHRLGANDAAEGGSTERTPNCCAYSAFSRCQPPNLIDWGPTMRPRGVALRR